MSHELDDILKHHGVKGMKWGVRRKIKEYRTGRALKKTVNTVASLDKYHQSKKNNKTYNRVYNTALKRTNGNHLSAVKMTRTAFRRQKQAVALRLTIGAAPLAVKVGRDISLKLAKTAMKPENIRRGKNVMNALKRSPVRVVDGKTMKNVINVGANLILK